MAELKFELDEQKSARNKRKHGVSFEEARTVFLDEDALLIPDPDDDGREERFVLLGFAASLRTLVVCHCYRQAGDVIRIISARKANQEERDLYTRRRHR